MGTEHVARSEHAVVVVLADGLQRCRIKPPGPTAFVQRQQHAAMMNEAGVGRIGRHLQEVRTQPAGNPGTEAAVQDALLAGLVHVLRGAHIAVAEVGATVVEGERTQHAVTVEPVSVGAATDALPARTIAQEGAHQITRQFAVDLLDPVVVLLVQVLQSTVTGRHLVVAGRQCSHGFELDADSRCGQRSTTPLTRPGRSSRCASESRPVDATNPDRCAATSGRSMPAAAAW